MEAGVKMLTKINEISDRLKFIEAETLPKGQSAPDCTMTPREQNLHLLLNKVSLNCNKQFIKKLFSSVAYKVTLVKAGKLS